MATDLFGPGTQQDILTGGDGAKSYGWNLLNGASADAIDVNSTNAGKLTINCNAVSSDAYNTQFNVPFVYQLLSGNFDVAIYDNGSNQDEEYEGVGIIARDPSASAGEDFVKIIHYYQSTSWGKGVAWGNNTNGVYSGGDTGGLAVHPYLRINRTGNVFTLYSKANLNDSWTQRAQYTRNDFASEIQVGIQANTVNTNNNFVAQIDYFEVNSERVVTVKSSGGDYTTLNAALSGESADLVNNIRHLTIECYASAAPDSTLADTGTGYTVSSSYYINIVVPTAERHAGKFSASKYYMTSTVVTGIRLLKFQEAYSRATGLQFYFNPSGALTTADTAIFSIEAGGCVVKNCIVKGPSSPMTGSYWCEGILVASGAASSPATFYCINCLGYNFQNSSSGNYAAPLGNDSSAITGYWYNCTAVGMHATYSYSAFELGTGGITNIVKNCLAAGVAKNMLFNAGTGETMTTNASQDTSADDYGGTGNRANQTFTFVDSGNEDYRLDPDDLGALGYGTNLYNDANFPFQDDIEGQDRGGSGAQWDIGADEYVPSAPICWGYADATETTKRTFTEGWTTGDGVISGSGNSEKITLGSGQTKESEVVQKSGSCRIRYNVYTAGSGTPTVQYKDGNSEANCNADSWHPYESPFTATGFVKVKLLYPQILLNETFETSPGYDESWTITSGEALIDPDYSTLESGWANQCARIDIPQTGEFIGWLYYDFGSINTLTYNRIEFAVRQHPEEAGYGTLANIHWYAGGKVSNAVLDIYYENANYYIDYGFVDYLNNNFFSDATQIEINTKYSFEFFWDTVGGNWEIRLNDGTLASGNHPSDSEKLNQIEIEAYQSESGNTTHFIFDIDNIQVRTDTWAGPTF